MPLASDTAVEVNECDMVFGLASGISTFKNNHANVNKKLNEGQHFANSLQKLAIFKKLPKYKDETELGFKRNEDAIAHIKNHPKYKNAIDTAEDVPRRKCKGILDFQIFGKGLPVHFILDDMDTKLAADKTSFHGGKERHKSLDVTHSELRWIFRNKDNPTVARSVQFWLNDKTVFPPWDASNAETKLAWVTYGDQVKNKRQAAAEQVFNSAAAELGAIDY
jgi:hypothetical protein